MDHVKRNATNLVKCIAIENVNAPRAFPKNIQTVDVASFRNANLAMESAQNQVI